MITVPNTFATQGAGNPAPPSGVTGTPATQLDANFSYITGLMNVMVQPVEAFGTISPGVDCSAVIQAALNAAKVVLLSPGKTYTITSKLTLNAGNVIMGYGAILKAGASFGGGSGPYYMIQAAAGTSVLGLTMDGTGLPSPSAAWLGVGTPTGSIFCGDGTSVACDGGTLRDVTMQNCPSGPVFMRQCNGWLFERVSLATAQGYTGAITNACLEFYNSNDNHIVDCSCNDFNWKGINLNGLRNKVTRPHWYGGAQNSGNAVYYEDGATDTTWTSICHEGAGFFFKAHNSTRCTLIDPKGQGTIYAQVFTDFKVLGGNLDLPLAANQAVILEGIAPSTGVAGGPGDTALIEGLTARRQVTGTTSNHVFLQLAPGYDSGTTTVYPVQHVTVRDCTWQNMLYGVRTLNTANTYTDDFVLDTCRGIDTVQYEVLSYAKNPTVRNCSFTRPSGSNSNVPIQVYGPQGFTGGTCELRGNFISDRTLNLINIGDSGGSFTTNFNKVEVIDNKSEGGNVFLQFDAHNSSQVDMLVVRGNMAHGIGAASAMTLTFHTSNVTAVNVADNFLIGGGPPMFAKNIAITNGAQISLGKIENDGITNDTTGCPIYTYPLHGSSAPAAGGFPAGALFRYTNAASGTPALAINYTAGNHNFQTVVGNQP